MDVVRFEDKARVMITLWTRVTVGLGACRIHGAQWIHQPLSQETEIQQERKNTDLLLLTGKPQYSCRTGSETHIQIRTQFVRFPPKILLYARIQNKFPGAACGHFNNLSRKYNKANPCRIAPLVASEQWWSTTRRVLNSFDKSHTPELDHLQRPLHTDTNTGLLGKR